LNEAGHRSELTVIGCRPKIEARARPNVRSLGYLDKRDEGDRHRFEHELGRAHFLLLPTHADCTPVAIAEAASLGVPSLSTAIGGITEMVVDGATGVLFRDRASPTEYRDAVIGLMADSAAYRRLALCARKRYDKELNWTTAAGAVEALIRERVLA
jgi:glycosyltransferase involved in cell wall biosynthesis